MIGSGILRPTVKTSIPSCRRGKIFLLRKVPKNGEKREIFRRKNKEKCGKSFSVKRAFPLNLTMINILYFPVFCDVHVHFANRVFLIKKRWKAAGLAAANGDLRRFAPCRTRNPVPDSLENLSAEMDAIEHFAKNTGSALRRVDKRRKRARNLPTLTEWLRSSALSDDGHGVQNEEMMLAAMTRAKRLEKRLPRIASRTLCSKADISTTASMRKNTDTEESVLRANMPR